MLECINTYILSLFPEGYDLNLMFWAMVTIFGVVCLAAVVIRFVFKTASAYLHALSSAMAILFFYLFNILLYPAFPELFGEVLKLLPLIDVTAEGVTLHTIQLGLQHLPEISKEFLPVLIFSGILIVLDDLVPDAKNTPSWILLQFGLVCATYIFYWAFQKFLGLIDLDFMEQYAPTILFCVLFTFVAMGILKIIFTLMLVSVSPLLGAVGAWFATSMMGKILGKSVLCAILLCAVCIYLSTVGLGTVVFAEISMLVYVPYMIIVLVLWVFTGHFL